MGWVGREEERLMVVVLTGAEVAGVAAGGDTVVAGVTDVEAAICCIRCKFFPNKRFWSK